ncbi:helix-turn-helix domain-containing protein [Streptomyces sp. CA-249302]|uniref:helix-turn-helix domain-containing protein n=1 Tax=Streptomyces sp. CA-249302 TaxID=3240058 RepID=UPI003D8D4DF9
MSGATGVEETEGFAQLLRELKDRSGLSYGALAKRLHMSTSTLHRYCNGTAVPVEYAPVERLARVCRATPQELVELHRRWILADAARRRRVEADASTGPPAAAVDGNETPGAVAVPAADEPMTAAHEPVVVDLPGAPTSPRHPGRRRTVLIAAVAVAAVLGASVLALGMPFGGDGTAKQRAGGTTETTAGAAGAVQPSVSTSKKATKPSASVSATPTGSASAGSGTSKSGGAQGSDKSSGDSDAVPLTVGVRPYVYDNPCSQEFLVDSEPAQVGPPANEPDAPRWAAAYGAVSAGQQEVALTVQGTGADTVVLEALHVRIVSKGAPLAWNDYHMGDGCGGGVETKAFDVDLDQGSPTVTVKGGQRDFPYKVSESDPEVFYVTAHTDASDVRWDLSLEWSSGDRHGTVHVDNDGTPFRTCTEAGRTNYVYPLGGSEWIKEGG